jgi:hypothetical protein
VYINWLDSLLAKQKARGSSPLTRSVLCNSIATVAQLVVAPA